MKLYDNKFLIYGNCMIRSFGQPGYIENENVIFSSLHNVLEHFLALNVDLNYILVGCTCLVIQFCFFPKFVFAEFWFSISFTEFS